MPAALKQVRKFEGERVRLFFIDGREETGILLCATKDMDGSEHIVYEPDPPQPQSEATSVTPCLYANARTLLSVEPVPILAVA